MDIAAAEEEITRWKVAAEQEAAAGRAVEQEYVSQVCKSGWPMYSSDGVCGKLLCYKCG